MASEVEQAMEELLRSKGAGDGEAAAKAVRSLVVAAAPGAEQLAAAAAAASDMLEAFRRSGSKAGQAHMLVALAELHCAQDAAQSALKAAEEAMELFRSVGEYKGLATALEVAFQANSAQQNPMAGLKAANKELAAVRQAGDKKGEVQIVEMISHAHAMLGEPLSAISSAQQALDIYRSFGDKEGEGSALHTIAEMRRANGQHPEAVEAARQSLAAFRAAKCAWGEERARGTISSLFAEQGKLEKAPNRPEAVKALRELVKAVEKRNSDDVKSAEERLNKMRDMVTDNEIAESLGALLQKDPKAKQFLKELGWSFGEVQGLEGTYIKQFSREAFYWHAIVSGIAFGPQFRAVHPWRLGRDRSEHMAMEVAQLPETEAWQMEMGYRPGIIDSTLQQTSVWGFP